MKNEKKKSHAFDEFPMQIRTNLLPDGVLHVQLFARFEQLEALQEFVELQ